MESRVRRSARRKIGAPGARARDRALSDGSDAKEVARTKPGLSLEPLREALRRSAAKAPRAPLLRAQKRRGEMGRLSPIARSFHPRGRRRSSLPERATS